MRVKDYSGAEPQLLVESAQRRIKGLQKEIGSSLADSEQKVRQLERVQLYHSVVSRLSSRDAVMPEVAIAQLHYDAEA
jgi:hypothetical protein